MGLSVLTIQNTLWDIILECETFYGFAILALQVRLGIIGFARLTLPHQEIDWPVIFPGVLHTGFSL